MPDFNLTTTGFAKKLGVSRQTVNELLLERNRISLSMKTVPGRRAKQAKPPEKTKKPKIPPKNDNRKNIPFNNPFAELLNTECAQSFKESKRAR